MDWDERYGRFGRCLGDDPNAFTTAVVETLEQTLGANLTLFFPGDGYGRCGLWAAGRGHDVIATDLSPVAVEMARAASAGMNVGYRTSVCAANGSFTDQPDLPFADAVVISWVRVADDPDGTVQRRWNALCAAAVRPGGKVALVTSPRVTSVEDERRAWPASIEWEHWPAQSAAPAEEIWMLGTRR